MKEFNSSGVKKVLEKGKKAGKIRWVACPFCREELNYATLWFYRKSNVGSCKQCGQRFRIIYSPLRFVIFFVLFCIAVFLGVMVYATGDYNKMFWCMILLALAFGIFYLVMPLTMKLKAIRGGTRTGVVDLNATSSMPKIQEKPVQRGARYEK